MRPIGRIIGIATSVRATKATVLGAKRARPPAVGCRGAPQIGLKAATQRHHQLFLASLDNLRFRWLLLILIGGAIVPAFALLLVVPPLVRQVVPGDLAIYLKAAAEVHSGVDPYSSWLADHSIDPTRRHGYIYPPLVAWSLSTFTTLPPIAVFAGAAVLDVAALVAFALLMARGLRVKTANIAPPIDCCRWFLPSAGELQMGAG